LPVANRGRSTPCRGALGPRADRSSSWCSPWAHLRIGAYPVAFGPMDDEPRGARAAREAGLAFELVRTERPSSADESARLQGIRLDQLLRTIVVRRGAADYVFVLVPGGRQIDWPKLRAHLGARRLSLPDREEAREATGYERGTITPFGA